MGTQLTHTRADIQPGRSSQTSAFAYAVLQIADPSNANINDTVFDTQEGWQTICRTKTIDDTETKDLVDIEGGLPKMYHDSIVVGIKQEIAVTGESFRKPLGTQVLSGSEIAVVPTYSATATTTVASATSTTVIVLTDASDFAVGDLVEFNLQDATYGGYKQTDKIKFIDNNTITLEDGLDYKPAATTDVKGVVSYLEHEGGNRLLEFKVRYVEFYHNGDLDISYYGICKVISKKKTTNDGMTAKEGTINLRVVPRTGSLLDVTGSTCTKPFLKQVKHISAVGIC